MVEDKRTRHTKERILRAMLVCLETTSVDRITVVQLCKTAQINRGTFYAHYPDPIALYKRMERKMADDLARHLQGFERKTISYKELLRTFLDWCREYSDLFLALYKTDSSSLKLVFLDAVGHYQLLPSGTPKDVAAYMFDYYVNGIFSVVARWLREDSAKSVDEMLALTYSLTRRTPDA